MENLGSGAALFNGDRVDQEVPVDVVAIVVKREPAVPVLPAVVEDDNEPATPILDRRAAGVTSPRDAVPDSDAGSLSPVAALTTVL
jgi:hypothetical protein